MPDPELNSGPHDPAEELLPWYATGQLASVERMRVEAHLSTCAECRSQLAVERRLVREFRAFTPEVESAWARLRSRIEEPPRAPRRDRPFAEFWRFLSRPAVAALAAAQIAFVVLAGGLLMSLSRPAYHALGSAPPPASANLIVIFEPATTEQTLRSSLNDAGATIVGGPTSANAYLLHVAPQQRQSAITRLHANGAVQMAEPIDGAAG